MRIVLVLLVVSGCSSASVEPSPSEASSIPLLPDGFTLGISFYGGGTVRDLDEEPRATLDAGIDDGIGGWTYYVEWADLEPEPGRYTLDEFTRALDDAQAAGLRPFVNVTVGDSEGFSLPGGVPDGDALRDPDVIARFGRLLDQVVPRLASRGGFVLALGNEMGEYLDVDRTARAAYATFVDAARQRVHEIEPRLAVAVTLTNGDVRNRSVTYRALRPVVDVVALNHSPIAPDFFVLDLDDVRRDLRDVLDAHDDGPVVIQELTCPNAESMGASDAWQAGCFRELFAEIEATPQVRFASVFTYTDFDEETCRLFTDALFGSELDDLPRDLAQRLADYTCGLGVVDVDGTPSPAWEVIADVTQR